MVRILKYSDGWTRRVFLERTAKGAMATGLLAPLWDVISDTGSCEAAYPPELLSLEDYTKGRLKAGQELNADNVDIVKDLLIPGIYQEIKTEGRVADLAPTTTDIYKLNPRPFIDATIKNRGIHHIGSDGNVWTKDGKPWIGGNPFPEPKNGHEALCAQDLSWGKLDAYSGGQIERDFDAAGDQQYEYHFYWSEWQMVGRRVLSPKPYEDQSLLRATAFFFTYPEDAFGASFKQIWAYDQRTFPTFYGYTPLLKRVRSFPTNQRFEPAFPGQDYYATYFWAIGDPLLTWGDFRVVSRGPLLYAMRQKQYRNRGWEFPTCGGRSHKKFLRVSMEIVPEVLVVEMKPTHFPRAPLSKKLVYIDARTGQALAASGYDRKDDPWMCYELGTTYYDKTDEGVDWPNEAPDQFWAYCSLMSYDMQSRRESTNIAVPRDHYGNNLTINSNRIYDEYLTMDALRRIGR